MKFFFGLDLGQAQDSTAIAIAERIDPPPRERRDRSNLTAQTPAPQTEFHLRHLERLKLGTTYPAAVEHVRGMLQAEPLKGATQLVVDATGCGRPVVDMLDAARLCPVAVTITSGDTPTNEGRWWRVPKRDLVVGLQVLLQSGRLKIAEGLPESATLVRELLAFKVKIDPVTAHDTYNARDGAHDDLVLAAALACWRAQMCVPFHYSQRPGQFGHRRDHGLFPSDSADGLLPGSRGRRI